VELLCDLLDGDEEELEYLVEHVREAPQLLHVDDDRGATLDKDCVWSGGSLWRGEG
jgi:hypothetical protein